MYEVQFLATSSADWAQAIELIDADTNLPLADIDDATFELSVDRQNGCGSVLTASTAAGTITQPQANVVQWVFLASQMTGLCDGSTYRVGLTMTTAGGTVQILIGTLTFVDGIV